MKSYNANTVQTAQLVEEKPQDIATTDCLVWSYNVDRYNQTGEVEKLEFLRVEKEPKLTAHQSGAHFVWDNKACIDTYKGVRRGELTLLGTSVRGSV